MTCEIICILTQNNKIKGVFLTLEGAKKEQKRLKREKLEQLKSMLDYSKQVKDKLFIRTYTKMIEEHVNGDDSIITMYGVQR